jgi:hypothetical protein
VMMIIRKIQREQCRNARRNNLYLEPFVANIRIMYH